MKNFFRIICLALAFFAPSLFAKNLTSVVASNQNTVKRAINNVVASSQTVNRQYQSTAPSSVQPNRLIYYPYQSGKIKGNYWQAAQNGQIPYGAIVSQSVNGKPSYLCQVQYNGHVIVGSILSGKQCNFSYQGKNYAFDHYLVLMK